MVLTYLFQRLFIPYTVSVIRFFERLSQLEKLLKLKIKRRKCKIENRLCFIYIRVLLYFYLTNSYFLYEYHDLKGFNAITIIFIMYRLPQPFLLIATTNSLMFNAFQYNCTVRNHIHICNRYLYFARRDRQFVIIVLDECSIPF